MGFWEVAVWLASLWASFRHRAWQVFNYFFFSHRIMAGDLLRPVPTLLPDRRSQVLIFWSCQGDFLLDGALPFFHRAAHLSYAEVFMSRIVLSCPFPLDPLLWGFQTKVSWDNAETPGHFEIWERSVLSLCMQFDAFHV